MVVKKKKKNKNKKNKNKKKKRSYASRGPARLEGWQPRRAG